MEVVHKKTRQQKRKDERDTAKSVSKVNLSNITDKGKLEASMIIKNEEEMLPKALDSMKGIDKITIVDTGSSDKSFDIYKQYQEKGYHLDFHEYSEFSKEPYSLKSFSHARNECKRKCISGDWLFILDGDEWFDWDIALVMQMINSDWIKKYDVITLNVKTAIETTQQPRVFRNIPQIWYYQAYHNSLRYWEQGTKMGPVGNSQVFNSVRFYASSLLIHAEYGPNHDKEPDRTLKIMEGALIQDPYDTRAMYYVGREWLQRKEPLKALFYFQKYIEIAPPTNEAADVYYILSTIYADMKLWHKVAEYALKAIGIIPSFKDALTMIYSISSPDFKEYWKPMLDGADNKGVMFVRGK